MSLLLKYIHPICWRQDYNCKRRDMTEKQLEFNLKGISNQKEFDKQKNKTMKQISEDSLKKFKVLLDIILNQKKYSEKDLRQLIKLANWVNIR